MLPLLKSTPYQDVDVYITTWTTSNKKHPYITEIQSTKMDITYEYIHALLTNLGVKIGKIHIECFDTWKKTAPELIKINIPLVYLWEVGVNNIRESNITYDYMLLLRPDLYFHTTTTEINWTNIKSNTIYTSMYDPNYNSFTELLVHGEFDIVVKSLPTVSDYLNYKKNLWWHDFLYSFIKDKEISISLIETPIHFCISKPPYELIYDFESALFFNAIWGYLDMEYHRFLHGNSSIITRYGIDLVKKWYPFLDNTLLT